MAVRISGAVLVRILIVFCAMVLLAACTRTGSDYPRLSEVPERPDPTLTPERSEELAQELRDASDDAAARAAEDRRTDENGEPE